MQHSSGFGCGLRDAGEKKEGAKVSLPAQAALPEERDSAEQGIMSTSRIWMISLVKIGFAGL